MSQMSQYRFTDNSLSTALLDHSDKTNASIYSRYLEFCLMRSLITLDSDNHVDNYFKEILAFVYYGSIVQSTRNMKF